MSDPLASSELPQPAELIAPPPAVDLKTLVHHGDLLAAVKGKFGATASIVDFEVKQGTETVQGFASLMLRAKVTVKVSQRETTETTIMIKRKPVVAAHAEMLDAMGEVNLRESIFFNQILPVLEEKAGTLPIVRPLVSHVEAILMEDMCASGYNTLTKSFLEIGRKGKVTLPVVRMVARKLAKLHAASLGTDWSEVMPGFFTQDPAMEGATAEQFKIFISNTMTNTVIPVMKQYYSETPNFQRYIDFFTGPKWFETTVEIVKDRSFSPCCVLHGDCWMNNIMFKQDPVTGKVLDAKFIDLQIVRFGSPVLDLLYFLYSCTSNDFRQEHEKDILQTYVNAFNTEANETPDLMHLEKLQAEFERARYFGVTMAMAFRPLQFLNFFSIPEGGELSAEFFAMVQNPSNWHEPTLKAYEEDEMVKKEFEQLILHTFDVSKKYMSDMD
jgi:thiamine kinase-like enzyme